MIEIKEQVVRATAAIIGPHSASAKALREAERHRNAGHAVRFFKDGNAILVVDVGADSATERKS